MGLPYGISNDLGKLVRKQQILEYAFESGIVYLIQ
jgi:hypothetical protein